MNPLQELNPNIHRAEELIPLPEGGISVPMSRISPPEGAIRENYGPLKKLKGSIKRRGVLQPLGLRPLDKEWRRFEPVIGCRRYFACSDLKLERVPCTIRQAPTEEDVAAIALEENRCRKSLTYREIFRAIDVLKKRGKPVKEIAAIAGMGIQSALAYLRLPSMPEQIRNDFFGKRITLGHLVQLMYIEATVALEIVERVKREKLSAMAVHQLVVMTKDPTKRRLPKQLRRLVGRSVFFGEGPNGIYLKICADNKRELCRTFASLKGSLPQLCALPWSRKTGRKPKKTEAVARRR